MFWPSRCALLVVFVFSGGAGFFCPQTVSMSSYQRSACLRTPLARCVCWRRSPATKASIHIYIYSTSYTTACNMHIFSIHINHYISAAFPPRFKIAVSHLPSQLCLQALVFSSPGLHKPGNPQAVNSWLEKRQRNLWGLWPFMAPETWKLQTLEIWHPPNKKQVSEKVLEDIFVSFNSNLFHKIKTQGGNHCC